ncbi:hypothetical protein [Allocoleopsis franciscana]|uniref:Uncharacterized protein n=1 Tax=Allocoleopsis franciscana PCC 7113 TaxID=1173027 RepID=K9WE68_9CYAN|nr:hypothetical protein [Allocoleopsis franciscana]AFZ18528.1 hypothetical protein Mic7113_2744 [Allocoleopsis franciscana PCC 7113]
MSDDQQKQPQSKSSPPRTLPISSATGQATGKTVGRTENQNKPFLKAQTLKVLRGTIGLLEGVVQKLEAEPVREIPPQATSPATTTVSAPVLDTTTATPETESVSRASELIADDTPSVTPEVVGSDTPSVTPEVVSSDTPSVTPEVVGSDTPSVTPEVVSSDTPTVTPEVLTQESVSEPVIQAAPTRLLDRILPTFDKLQAFWDATLTKVRSLLPAVWNQKLSDWALTSAIAGIVVVIMVATAALLPETPAQEAKAPPNTIDAPPELKAPKPAQPVEVIPPPEPELTPEQSLVASIQQQVAEITDRYGNGLIQSIEANFMASRLMVKVSDRWYELKESQQNKLADEILRRSRELDFSRLEITDLQGTLVARNPVVGSNMVILKRQELAVNL